MKTVVDPATRELLTVTDVKKQARLEQLSQARQSAKDKKLKEKEQLSDMSSKLDKLTAALLAKEEKKTTIIEEKVEIEDEPEERPKKRVRVTVVEPEEETASRELHENASKGDSFLLNACRTGLVVGLAATLWYVQNVWKKTESKSNEGPKKRRIFQAQAPQNNLLHAKNPVGRSGFVM
jgi:hypothetical protein